MNKSSKEKSIDIIVQNNLEVAQTYGAFSKSTFVDTPRYKGLTAEFPSPVFNQIIDAQFDPNNIQDSIEEIMAPYKERGIVVIWKIWPSSTPNDLEQHLIDYGFHQWGDAPGMLADLSQLPQEKHSLKGLQIKFVSTNQMVKDWVIPFEEGFTMGQPQGKYFDEMFREFGYSPENPMRNYVAYLNDQPAACGTLYLGKDNVAGIWNIATVESARGKGIGTAITRKMCEDALEMGYHTGVLTASKDGLNIYKKLGFKEYCNVAYYGWLPEEPK